MLEECALDVVLTTSFGSASDLVDCVQHHGLQQRSDRCALWLVLVGALPAHRYRSDLQPCDCIAYRCTFVCAFLLARALLRH